ncbi:MAG TPA: response regulator transcription factor [Chloroflexi bacterium]|nr:response regulator transcription factor [Chloroflexota bacterium]
MNRKTILIVDDEPKIVRFVKATLDLAGYNMLTAGTGRMALTLFESEKPDLIILDLGLPDIDGFEVLRQIRSYSTVPIVILTARDDEKDKVHGLELGADDYLTKPFGTQELKARIQAVLRRVEWSPQPSDLAEFTLHDLHVDFRRRKVFVAGEEIHLTPTEYELLRVLIQHAGQVLLHGDLLSKVWGEEYRNDLAILRVNISRLRQKLESDPRQPRYILTVPGVGYTMPAE